ncbi:MAG: hypothetical protein WC708_00770 [Lentisphaeria bacterium]|jgi:hypothetical protein
MTTVSGSGFEFSIESTGGAWSWAVVSKTIPGVGPFYEVHSIRTPWGSLCQTAIPIPAEVITGMADSIAQIQQQLSPLLALVNPSEISFVISITEGDPNQIIANIPFTNTGSFGSSLTATATPNVPWLKANPGYIGGIGRNEQASFSVTLITGTLLQSGSPYLGVLNLQDNRNPPTVIPIAFSISVLPRPVIAAAPTSINFVWYGSSHTGSGPFTVAISNSGPVNSILNWSASKVQNNSSWLSVVPATGGPLASGASQDVQFSLVSACVPYNPGVYTETVRFSSPNASNHYVDVVVTLTIIDP